MAADEGPDWLVRLYEEQGASLHRLAVLLGAEEQSGRIVRGALLTLHRRSHRIIDPAERIEFLQEHVVHAARAVRPPQLPIALPTVEEPRQDELLRQLSELPPRMSELMVVSHYLGVFGPELAGVMRMSLRGSNQKLEIVREALRANLDDGESPPAGLEALSQEVTAALRAAARTVQPPGTETLAAELAQLGEPGQLRIGSRTVVALTVLALLLGLVLAALTRPDVAPTEPVNPSQGPVARPTAARSMPAQVRGIPIYYVGRQDHALYREQRDLASSGDLVRSALDAILTVPPADPDYMSMWNAGQVLGVEKSGDSLVIDLSQEAYADLEEGAASELARNQVVYTITDLVADPELSIMFLSDGGTPPAAFVSVDGFRRGGLELMPSVWITTPRNLARLSGGVVMMTGVVKPGNGDPLIRITDTDRGRVIAEESAQTSTAALQDGWLAWSLSAELPPGRYEVSARVVDAPSTATIETKTFEVS